MENRSIGKVKKNYFTFGEKKSDRLLLESGIVFGPITIAYETYGTLNVRRDNAILIQHTLTMDSHAAGFYNSSDKKPGWWDNLIGPRKAFDTEKFFIICSNIIGGCSGSTGPSSNNPDTGKPYGTEFPFISLPDMIKAQKKLLDFLGIKKLFSVAGGSMGGMLALQIASDFPEFTASVISISAAWKQSPMQIAFSEVARQSIIRDPNWNNGDYYERQIPKRGLSLSRMIGHITYMSEISMEEKFSRRLKNKKFSNSFDIDFEVESYLNYNGNSFVDRFDANSFLYITRALNYFDVSGNKLIKNYSDIFPSFLLISFDSDWLYPHSYSEDIIHFLMAKGVNTTYAKIKSSYGHDAFLLEQEKESGIIKNFLERICEENEL